MMSIEGVQGYSEVPERFQGITELDPKALGHFAFFVASNHIQNHFEDNGFSVHQPDEWEDAAWNIVNKARMWKEGGRLISRYEFAKQIQKEREDQVAMETVVAAAKEADAASGLDMVVDWMETNGYTLRKAFKPSPMFPDGREQRVPISHLVTDYHTLDLPRDADIRDEERGYLPDSVAYYINTLQPEQRNREAVTAVMELISPIDAEHYQALREQYGAKAAALLSFKEKIDAVNDAAADIPQFMQIKVPPFLPVSVDTYDLWKHGDTAAFEAAAEALRQQIIELSAGFGTYLDADLVAVRSSAVQSEDGEEHTGAGVYLSVTADPNNPAAFRNAIEQVYASCDSPSAQSYRELIGIGGEKMGLIIQPYLERQNKYGSESSFFGDANSIGANPNLIEVNTNHGELLIGKPETADNLLVWDYGDGQRGLHSTPDHNNTDLWQASNHAGPIAHAAIVAERLFGEPMQLEFVNDYIVQVRPLLGVERDPGVEFPTDLEPHFTGRGVGIGDMELELLDTRRDNSKKRGFVVFEQEYAFTDAEYHRGYKAFPKEGAVIIIAPSSSGHIQAYCREKGLLCFYSLKDEEIQQLSVFNRGTQENKTYRFISDGYRGSIY